jgi:hypothetical protein
MRELEHSKNLRISEIMLEVQKAKEFPLQVKVGRGTATIHDEREATFFSLGILMAIEAETEEHEWEIGDPDQGVFEKDKNWQEMKCKEKKELIDKYPDFYRAIRAEAEKINLNMDEMYYEILMGDAEEIEVQYYPYAEDWTLRACWSVSQNKLIEFGYNDNKN